VAASSKLIVTCFIGRIEGIARTRFEIASEKIEIQGLDILEMEPGQAIGKATLEEDHFAAHRVSRGQNGSVETAETNVVKMEFEGRKPAAYDILKVEGRRLGRGGRLNAKFSEPDMTRLFDVKERRWRLEPDPGHRMAVAADCDAIGMPKVDRAIYDIDSGRHMDGPQAEVSFRQLFVGFALGRSQGFTDGDEISLILECVFPCAVLFIDVILAFEKGAQVVTLAIGNGSVFEDIDRAVDLTDSLNLPRSGLLLGFRPFPCGRRKTHQQTSKQD